jgi:hypothetical protein
MTRRCLRLAVIIGLATACVPETARSQRSPGDTATTGAVQRLARQPGLVSPGDTVRLFAGGQLLVQGVLTATDSDALFVVPGDLTDPVRFQRRWITAAEVLRGQRPHGAGALDGGVLVSLAAGSVVGTLVSRQHTPGSDGTEALGGLIVGGAVAVIGIFASALVATHLEDQWIRFDPGTFAMLPPAG